MILTPFKASLNDNGGFDLTTIFSSSSKKAEEVANGINEDVQALTNFQNAVKMTNDPINAFQQYMTGASQSAKDYSNELVGKGKGSVEQYATAQLAASKSITSVGTSSKLAAVGVKALNVAMNIGIWIAITEAITLAYKAIDNWVNRVQNQEKALSDASQAYSEAKQKVTDTNTQLDETSKKITELQSKGSLTFVEQDQLNTLVKSRSELEKELELQKLIAEQKQKTQTDEAIKTLNNYGSQRERYVSGDKIGQEVPIYDLFYRATNGVGVSYNNQLDALTESNTIPKLIEQYKELSKATGDHKTQLDSLKSSLTTIAQQYKQAADSITPYDDATKKAKNDALNIYDSILKVADAEQYAKNQTNNFNSVWKSDTYKSVANELSNISKQGQLTAQILSGSKYSGFVKSMENAGLSVSDVVNQINSLNRSTSTTDNSLSGITSSLSSFGSTVSSISTEITNLGKSFKDLDDAIASVEEGQSLSGEQVITLLGEYPELADAIQTTSSGYTFQISVLQQLRQEKIKEQSDSIQAEITKTQETLSATSQRLQAYQTEIQGINSLAQAEAKLAGLKESGNNSASTQKQEAALQTYIDYNNDLNTINQDQTKLKALQTELTIVTQPNYTKALNKTTEATKQAKSASEDYKNALEKQKDALDQEKKALQFTYDQMQTDQENIKSLLSLVEEMLKQQYSDQKDNYSKLSQQAQDLADKEKTALETQLSALKDKIDLQKKALDQQKEERSHAEDLADKEKDIAALRTKLAIQQQDTSDASKAKQIQYQKQIADKTKELNDFQYDYSVTTQQNALDALQDKYDKEYKAKEDELDKETTAQKNYYQGLIDQIEAYTSKEVNIRTEAMNLINGKSQDLLNRLIQYNNIYGDGVKNSIVRTWSLAYDALSRYNGNQLNVLNTLNQLINRMDTYKNEIQGVDNQISSLESKISDASRDLSSLQNQANGAASALGGAANSAKRAEVNAKRTSLQAEIAKLTADDASGRGYSSHVEVRINELQRQLDALPQYATGTRYSVGGAVVKDENGYELTLSPTGGGRYAMAKEGSQIFTSDMTDALWNFSNNPAKFMMDKIESLSNSGVSNISNISKTNNSPIKLEMPLIIQGTPDESILKGLRSEHKAIVGEVYSAINNMNRRAGNNFGI